MTSNTRSIETASGADRIRMLAHAEGGQFVTDV